jgi:hypothetical protein
VGIALSLIVPHSDRGDHAREGADRRSALGAVFRRALDVMGATRLLLGTDSSNFPRGWDYEIFEAQSPALLDLGVSSTDARLILEESLARMFEGNPPAQFPSAP